MALTAIQQAEIEDQVYKILGGLKIKLGREDIIPPIEEELKEMISKAITPLAPEIKAKIAAVLEPISGESSAMKFLKKYCSPGAAKKPVQLIGDQGSGKTTVANQFAFMAGFQMLFTLTGHEGVDAQSMLGGLRPWSVDGKTTTVMWQDGPVTAAVRAAGSAMTTLLYIDELLRIKVRERSPLIGILSPIRYPDGEWYYRVETGRVMEVEGGVATKVETIKAPTHMLSIISSTNIGGAFDVQAGDPAEAGRWLQYDLQTTAENVKRIVGTVLKERGFSISLTPKFVKMLEEGKKLKADNFLMLEPDVRILCDGIKLAENEMDIGNAMFDAARVWVGRTIEGKRSPEQSEQLRNLITRHFPIKPDHLKEVEADAQSLSKA